MTINNSYFFGNGYILWSMINGPFTWVEVLGLMTVLVPCDPLVLSLSFGLGAALVSDSLRTRSPVLASHQSGLHGRQQSQFVYMLPPPCFVSFALEERVPSPNIRAWVCVAPAAWATRWTTTWPGREAWVRSGRVGRTPRAAPQRNDRPSGTGRFPLGLLDNLQA